MNIKNSTPTTSNILIAEDSATQRLMLQNTLIKEGFIVEVAKNGMEALQFLENSKIIPDLVISDIEMPMLNGYELCKKIIELKIDTFSILLTANNDEEALKKSFNSGAIDFLNKPFSKTELLLRINNVLRIKNAEKLLKRAMGELEYKNRVLKKVAITDELTELVNRRHLMQTLKEKMYAAERYSLPLSIILFDIDHFKKVNDTYGHLIGDSVLARVAQVFKKHLRKTDIAGRYGGEEFLIILSNTQLRQGITVAKNICQYIKELEFDSMPDKTISLSGGICEYNNEIRCEDLLSRVDDLLYVAKNNGRDRIEF